MRWKTKNHRDSEKSSLHYELHYGFIAIVIAFLIPNFFLFYFMISFKTEIISLARNEIRGSKNISQAIQDMQGSFASLPDFHNELQRITDLSRASRMQLDISANSYYSMVVVFHSVPSMLDTLLHLRSTPPQTTQYAVDTDRLSELKKEAETWLNLSRTEDAKIGGPPSDFQKFLAPEKENYFAAVDRVVKAQGQITAQDTADLFRFWSFMNDSVRVMLQRRIAMQSRQLLLAVSLTLLAWFVCIAFTLWFFRKVRERRQALQDQIRQQDLTLMMASKMTALGELAGNIAHEVNTPLGAIRLNAELIEQLAGEDPLPAKQIATLSSNLNKTVDKISQIISSMLKYSRTDSKDSFVLIDLSTIFHEAILLCQENIHRKGIDLKMEVSPNLQIQCRPNEILQVILNLVKNSIDAVENLPEKWILIEAGQKEKAVVCSITDSGLTKSISDPHQIFTPFYSTKPTGQGTGLGLGISRRLIESHQGELRLDEQSLHTRFVIHLPAYGAVVSCGAGACLS